MTTRQRLCHRNEIPDEGSKGFDLPDKNIFAVKKRGEIYVYQNSCPHIGIALEWVADQFLDSSNSLIQCANHGALFTIETGRCVAGPCSGQSLIAIPFVLVDGYLEVEA